MKHCLFFLFVFLASISLHAQPCNLTDASGCDCRDGSNDCDLLPDIKISRDLLADPSANPESPGLLRVSVSTPNVGHGPLETRGTDYFVCGTDTVFSPGGYTGLCPDGSEPKQIIQQRIYHKNPDGSMGYYDRDAGTMTYHQSHGHMHVDNWGFYTIREEVVGMDPLDWPIVGTGSKLGFCLLDLSNCVSSYGHCRDDADNILTSDAPNYGLGGGTYGCSNVVQGISAGYVDIYSYALTGMQVVIPPGTCNGDYMIVVHVDPDNNFIEENDANNVMVVPITLTEQTDCSTPSPCGAYCASAGSNTSDEWIESLTAGGLSWTNGNNGGYANFADTFAVSYDQSSTYSLSLTPGYTGTIYAEYWRIWIDYNQDGDFEDADELVFDAGSTSTTTVSGSFTVPASALSGTTSMRVSMKYNEAAEPCEIFTWGEVEDYCVTIGATVPSCPIPSGMNSTPLSTTQATVSWNPVTEAINYGIQGRKAGNPVWQEVNTSNVTNTYGIFKPGRSYEWRVRSQCAGGVNSDYSAITGFTMPVIKGAAREMFMSVYPNPTSSSLTLEYVTEGDAPVYLTVHNMLGELMIEKELPSGAGIQRYQIETDNLIDGVYLLETNDGLSGGVRQFVVQR